MTMVENGAYAAIVLAAGQSSRMGTNKLLLPWRGEAVIRAAVTAALASQARPVVVVTGHEQTLLERALTGLDVRIAHNPDFARGMATSLSTGLAAVPPSCAGALIILGDMPELDAALLDRLITAARSRPDRICVASYRGRRGHPVLWPRRFFAQMMLGTGDKGARSLLDTHADDVETIAVDDTSVLDDIDTPADFAALTARAGRSAA